MLLLQYNNFNPTTEKFTVGAEVKHPYIVSLTPVADYTDITSIINWQKRGENILGGFFGFRDFKKLRSEIQLLVNNIITFGITGTTNAKRDWDIITQTDKNAITNLWNTKLTADERKVAADYFVVPLDLQLTVINSTPYWVVQGLSFFDKRSSESRLKRIGLVTSEVKNRIGKSNSLKVQRELNQIGKGTLVQLNASNQLVASLRGLNLAGSYITEGIEGTVEENDPEAFGLFDYILSRAGTPFDSGKGLSSQTFSVNGFANMSSFANYVFDILDKGNY